MRNSDRPLDILNVAVAGMRDGVGPLLAVFLIRYAGLEPSGLSWVMAAPGLAALFLQIPMGFLYDRIADRRLLLSLGALTLMTGAFLISRVPGFYGLLLAQALVGLAMAALNVGLPALSLQLSGAEGFGRRLARNEVFCKVGNFTALGITGVLTQKFGLPWMFTVLYVFAGAVILAALRLPRVGTPNALASPAESSVLRAPTAGNALSPDAGRSWRETLRSAPFLTLISLTSLFYFANSSMLFVFEQDFVPKHANGGAGYISSAQGLNQVVIFFASLFLARLPQLNAVKFLGLGFGLIFLRGITYGADLGLVSLGVGSFLDGLIGAVVIIVPTRALAALDPKNFNVLAGFVGTSASLGASASTIGAGYLIQHVGHANTFLTFAAVGASGLAGACLLGGVGGRALRTKQSAV